MRRRHYRLQFWIATRSILIDQRAIGVHFRGMVAELSMQGAFVDPALGCEHTEPLVPAGSELLHHLIVCF